MGIVREDDVAARGLINQGDGLARGMVPHVPDSRGRHGDLKLKERTDRERKEVLGIAGQLLPKTPPPDLLDRDVLCTLGDIEGHGYSRMVVSVR